MLTTLTVGLHISALGNTVIVNAKIIHKPKVPTYTLNLVELITGIGLDELGSFNSLGPKFSSQGHFHSPQLLNIPQFLFSRLVRLKTAPRGNFSHA